MTAPQSGRSFPLGASRLNGAVNFSVYSRSATAMELLLFDDSEAQQPSRVIALDPTGNRTFHYWHVAVPDITDGQIYAWRADGPFDPAHGHRFDADKVLLDPYGRAVVVPEHFSRTAAKGPGDTAATAMKSVFADPRGYDWQGDRPLRTPFPKTVIYEMHVAGFTRHPSSGVDPARRGTYAGLVDRIPYLVDLGITAIELLPVFQYDHHEAPPGLTNYWGYCPVSFFAPHAAYSSNRDPLGPIHEFRDMVKALHRAGIEVILDVVYNHTAEGSAKGPTYTFRGLDNASYYIADPEDPRKFANYSGTGNTLNANRSVVRRLILDSLRYWVREMHVDGFRFDLASILSRDEFGRPLESPPVLWDIETDPVLAGTKLIAEAWDAAGLYQVGSFVGDHWKEWNGVFRDDVRRFFRGDDGAVRHLPSRLLASPDLYGHEEREPEQSINFVTCHDGFTANDLVSYRTKHNQANGEENRDGSDFNLSWNHGEEGPSDDPEIESLRNRQVKNLLAMTLISLGTPMILMGDEVRRTQQGNNNPYCQDNELSWFDWGLLEDHADVHRFVRRMIDLRLHPEHLTVSDERSLNEVLRTARIHWHGVRLFEPDWSDASRSLAVTVRFAPSRLGHLMLNAWSYPLDFELPPVPRMSVGGWRRQFDTALASPDDISDPGREPAVDGTTYTVAPHAMVLVTASLTRRN